MLKDLLVLSLLQYSDSLILFFFSDFFFLDLFYSFFNGLIGVLILSGFWILHF